jgi:hypothetical protein
LPLLHPVTGFVPVGGALKWAANVGYFDGRIVKSGL